MTLRKSTGNAAFGGYNGPLIDGAGMKFTLIDRVEALEAGRRIVAWKNLTLAEEYLQDHFPRFPVEPGVLMIEALVQAGAWLERISTDFEHSMVVLDEIRNVRYGAFFRPGTSMRVEVELMKQPEPGLWLCKGVGTAGEETTVQGRFVLRGFNLADDDPEMAETDRRVVSEMRTRWAMIRPKAPAV